MTGPNRVRVPSSFPLVVADAADDRVRLEVGRHPVTRAQLVLTVVGSMSGTVTLDPAAVRALVQTMRHWLAGRLVDVPPAEEDSADAMGGLA